MRVEMPLPDVILALRPGGSKLSGEPRNSSDKPEVVVLRVWRRPDYSGDHYAVAIGRIAAE
jgi:hypothetical protein